MSEILYGMVQRCCSLLPLLFFLGNVFTCIYDNSGQKVPMIATFHNATQKLKSAHFYGASGMHDTKLKYGKQDF